MDQSLFTRFVRLGMPVIQLNAQGRCRPSIAELWNWRYKDLANLPAVVHGPRFRACNPGLAHEFQLIDVANYNGVGESSPQAYFYQVRFVSKACYNMYLESWRSGILGANIYVHAFVGLPC